MDHNEAQPMEMDENRPIDEALYSRQLYVMDHESMKKMTSSSVLLIGLRGLGVEIAKNLILAGVKSVTLHDDTPATLFDLSAQFYLTEKDIGKPRAEASLLKLIELNSYVRVQIHTGEITEEVLKRHQVVISTTLSYEKQVSLDQLCRKNSVKFIGTQTFGVFSNIFCDFGPEFTVQDPTGEPPAAVMIASITQDNPGLVTVVDDQRLPFEDGDLVTFTEVQGMTELNGSAPRKITIKGPYTFEIDNTSNFSTYKVGGYVTQVKQPVKHSFLSLEESFEKPEFLTSDFAKIDRELQLHLGFKALGIFQTKHSRFPNPRNEDDANELVKIVQELNEKFPQKVEKLDEKIIKLLSYGSQGELASITAFMGGFAAQEALKACTGKFTPIKQWFYFDTTEILPPEDTPAQEFQPVGCRYDGQIIVLGRALQEHIKGLNYFLVGAGAIGCEVLKIWAMMGLGSGPKGMIHITDMDIIEKSNLNRQFLFRPKDIEHLKSETAAKAVQAMNPELHITSYSSRVGPDTEELFNESFYESLSGVCNALDNVEARLYMDSQCILYQKPLLESGTLGTKGNTQVVVPFKTESYASSRDPPEKSIPQCTLHHFPNTIDHTIQWSRDVFEGLFKNQAESVNSYITIPGFMENLKKQSSGVRMETLNQIKNCLVSEKPTKFEDCVQWARNKFEEFFNHNIQQLIHMFPPDMITSTGAPFWSGPKRAPNPIQFDIKNPMHLEFVTSAANLRAFNFGLKTERNPEVFVKILPTISVLPFVPKKLNIKLNENEPEPDKKEENEDDEDDDVKADKILSELPSASKLTGYKLNPIDFEKDDDTNFHMDFIAATANLRAANYSIPAADKHKVKGIAGKIIPAMVTTTAVVCGLVCIELLKIIQNKKIDEFKNGFVNLALPFVAFSEPLEPQVTKVREDWKWSLWDRFDVDGDITLQEFLDLFKNKYQLEVSMISSGVSMIYSFFMNKEKLNERLPKKVSEVIETVSKQPLPKKKNYLTLEVCVNRLEDDEEVDVPYVKYVFKK